MHGERKLTDVGCHSHQWPPSGAVWLPELRVVQCLGIGDAVGQIIVTNIT